MTYNESFDGKKSYVPEVTPGLQEITPTVEKKVPIEIIDGALRDLIEEENGVRREEPKKPTLH